MAYTITHTSIKKASGRTLDRLRKIGEEKALRLQGMKECWENGDYENVEVIQLH